MEDYNAELLEDPIMKTHIELLFNTFMEKKICQFIKPYCQVKVYIRSTNCLLNVYLINIVL